jgi:hypothetical protein
MDWSVCAGSATSRNPLAICVGVGVGVGVGVDG